MLKDDETEEWHNWGPCKLPSHRHIQSDVNDNYHDENTAENAHNINNDAYDDNNMNELKGETAFIALVDASSLKVLSIRRLVHLHPDRRVHGDLYQSDDDEATKNKDDSKSTLASRGITITPTAQKGTIMGLLSFR